MLIVPVWLKELTCFNNGFKAQTQIWFSDHYIKQHVVIERAWEGDTLKAQRDWFPQAMMSLEIKPVTLSQAEIEQASFHEHRTFYTLSDPT